MKSLWLILNLAAMLTSALSTANSDEVKGYPSPDGRFVAQVVRLPSAPYGSGENRIVLRSNKGRIVCSEDFSSEDGEHGYGVEKAAWTPDSKFFVFSLT